LLFLWLFLGRYFVCSGAFEVCILAISAILRATNLSDRMITDLKFFCAISRFDRVGSSAIFSSILVCAASAGGGAPISSRTADFGQVAHFPHYSTGVSAGFDQCGSRQVNMVVTGSRQRRIYLVV
jgi:hypothetical protein